MEEDIDPVLQDLQCSQVHTCCQAGDLQDLQDLLGQQGHQGRPCPAVELQARRNIQAWEGRQGRSCIPEDMRDLLRVEEDQVELELQEDPEVGLLPFRRGEPGRGVAAGSEGSGWSRPFERVSSGFGVTATKGEF